MIKKLRAYDLFAGIGGFRAGAMEYSTSMFEFVGYCEMDKYSKLNYDGMFGSQKENYIANIHTVTRKYSGIDDPWNSYNKDTNQYISDHIPAHDILFAGFPCQPHSLMGNRRGLYDTRGELFFDIAAVIRSIKPKYFILENVRSIRSVNDGQLMKQIEHVLEKELGYNVSYLLLDSKNYGVPQTRRRIYMVGTADLDQKIGIPQTVEAKDRKYLTTWHLLEREVEDKYYLSERILKTILKSVHKGYSRPAEINKLVARPLTKTMHKMHRASQDNYYSDPFIKGEYDEDSGVVSLNPNATSRIRRITPREAFRIQGFSEDLTNKALSVGLSDTRYYMHTGNAVSPNAVAKVLDELLKGKV
jgi:DNA (cytosine-5)-methyltransferase 1